MLLSDQKVRAEEAAVATRRRDPLEGLTRRERETAGLVARGLSNVQIGVALGVSETTIKKHVSAGMRKLGCSRRGELALRAGVCPHCHRSLAA